MKQIICFFILLLTFYSNAEAQVSGTVFRDINGNGTQQASFPAEPGLPGVTIKAYDNNEVMLASVVSDINGYYSFSVAQIPLAKGVRLEFEVPAPMTALFNGTGGNIYGSAVQFVQAPAANVNIAFNSPKDYVQENDVTLFTPLHWSNTVSGSAAASEYASRGSLVLFKESYAGISPAPDTAARFSQTGVTWGTAMHKPSKTIFAASFFRKWGSFGPGGQSAIYSIKAGPDGNLTTGADNEVNTFVKLDDYFGAGSAGANPFANPAYPYGDSMLVGKVAFGDIDMSVTGDMLYALNLHDRKIYSIPVNSTATTPAPGSISASPAYPSYGTCGAGAGVLRPFGMAVNSNDGKIYVAAACELNSSLLYVFGYNPALNVWDAEPIIQFTIQHYTDGPCCWGSWNSYYDWMGSAMPQGLDFDISGKFLALTYVNLKVYRGITRNTGNIIRFSNNAGSWVAESAGVSGGVTGFSTTNGQGPGGGEFYDDQSAEFGDISIMGGLLQIPGRTNIAATLDDPFTVYTAGVSYLNNNNGSSSYKYRVFENTFTYPMPTHVFEGKKNVMGDIEYLSEAAPIEIGNRVWNDTNGDGIQQHNEPGMGGVELQLLNTAGTLMASVTTDAKGNYYFTSAAGTNVTGITYGVPLQPNSNYIVRIKGVVNAGSTITGNSGLGAGNYFTVSNSTGSGKPGWSDNDGVVIGGAGGTYEASITTGTYGQSNHNIDFGFITFSLLPATGITASVTVHEAVATISFKVVNSSTGVYYLERSLGNNSYSATGQQLSASATNAVQTYSLQNDISNINSTVYYRVKFIDKTGAVYYSNTVMAKKPAAVIVNAWPNPFIEKINITIYAAAAQTGFVQLFDAKGALVKSTAISLYKGNNNAALTDVKYLHAGTYFIYVRSQNGDISFSQKLLKK